jgi:hypothetical protein
MTEEMKAIGLQEKKERPHGHLQSHGRERLTMSSTGIKFNAEDAERRLYLVVK